MALQGRLTEWNDDRGFGFITPLDGGSRVFAHIGAFPHELRRPMAMDLVTYEVGQGGDGRPRAVGVYFLAPTRRRDSSRLSPTASSRSRVRKFALVAIVLLVLAGVTGAAFAASRLLHADAPNASPPAATVNEARTQQPAMVTTAAAGVNSAPTKTAKKSTPTKTAKKSTQTRPTPDKPNPAETRSSSDEVIGGAFDDRKSGVEVDGAGVVDRVLSDDNDGARHQRFILRLASEQTLLVAHNIDIAPRIASLRVGDTVQFKGEYEWSAQGGVIHWTHRDPNGKHLAGWLKHDGQTSR